MTYSAHVEGCPYLRAGECTCAPAHPDPIRELLAFMIARELGAVCNCGQPSTVWSDRSCLPPKCDTCARAGDRPGDWKDLPHAAAIRRLLTT